MFASTGSASQSNSGISGCSPFGLGNQKGDAFASKTLFDFPPGMPNYGGTSTWGSSQTSSSLFSTTFGAPSFSGFGSSMAALGSSSSTPVEGHSSCCKFGCSPVFTQWNKKGDSFASNSHGTSNWTFNQTSSPFSSSPAFGVPFINGLKSSSSGGSRIAGYGRTAESPWSGEEQELISISAMPTYKAKSHEELRWEDYKITGRGGFGICSSGDSKPVANFSSSGSWGTTSNSTTLVKPNPFGNTFPSVATEPTSLKYIPFGNTFPSVATEPTSLKYPCPTCTPTWKHPGLTSTAFTLSLANTPFSPSSAPSNSFNRFVPTTTLPSTATHTSSSSFSSPTFPAFTSSLASTPSYVNAFWSTPTAGPFTSSVPTVSPQWTSNLNQPTTLFNHFVPSTLNSNGTPTTSITTTTRAILDEINNKQQPISDYYTIPPISEVEAKEKAEPGFGSRIKDFVIGCFGYGSINFLGETDVRNLDPETHVQFNHCDVIVYTDETNKPPVGEGLNKPAEITLLNIKFIDKKTGVQYIEGSKIDGYTEMLKKAAVAQGAEFMSYDPIEGEWKFRVEHF